MHPCPFCRIVFGNVIDFLDHCIKYHLCDTCAKKPGDCGCAKQVDDKQAEGEQTEDKQGEGEVKQVEDKEIQQDEDEAKRDKAKQVEGEQGDGEAKQDECKQVEDRGEKEGINQLQNQKGEGNKQFEQGDKKRREADYLDIKNRYCRHCSIQFKTIADYQNHLYHVHASDIEVRLMQQTGRGKNPIELTLTRKVMDGAYTIYDVDLSDHIVNDINGLFYSLKDQVIQTLTDYLKTEKNFKVQFDLDLLFSKVSDDELRYNNIPMKSFAFTIENEFAAKHAYDTARENFDTRIDKFCELASGQKLEKVISFKMILLKTGRFLGGSGQIELPAILSTKTKSLLNVPNSDNLCFQRCVIAAIYGSEVPQGHHRKELLRSQKFYDKHMDDDDYINWEGIKFPFDIMQVQKFENQNLDIALNILCYDENPEDIQEYQVKEDLELYANEDIVEKNNEVKTGYERKLEIYNKIHRHIYPIKICKEERKHIIDLLLIQNGEEGHIVLIENWVGFLRHPGRKYVKGVCRFCLQSFGHTYDDHVKLCVVLDQQKVNWPKNDYQEFNKWRYCIKMPYVLYADFESMLVPTLIKTKETKYLHEHVPSAYSWTLVDHDMKVISSETYCIQKAGENILERFIAQVCAISEECRNEIYKNERLAYMKAKDSLATAPPFINNSICGFCEMPITRKDAVRHHSHLPPFKFEFWAHNACNLQAKVDPELHCFLQNLTGYDSKYILKSLANKSIVTDIEVIGKSVEKFSSLRVNKGLLFLDSLNFFHAPLDKIVNSMNKEDLKLTTEYFSKLYGPDKVSMLLQKGIYPYEYFDCVEKYDETELPAKYHFFSQLTQKEVTEDEYNWAKSVWSAFNIKNLREYTELYVTLDTFLTADVFENMRNVLMDKFTLDPAHYYSVSQLSWDCFIKSSKIKLNYIKDPNLYCWIESCLRGGISMGGSIKYAKANNKYLPTYNKNLKSEYILYLDLNALYPTSMSTHMPTGEGMRFATAEELESIDQQFIMNIDDEASKGYFLEVDLSFPEETHQYFQDLPPAPYKRGVDYDELSQQQKQMADKLNVKEKALTTSKLIADLLPRKNYRLHYRVLKFYLSIGVKLDKIHNAVVFTQSPILKPYIDYLKGQRKAAKSKTEQDWYKILGNCIYGKSIENLRKRNSFKIVRSHDEAVRYNRKPTVQDVVILDEEMAIIRLRRREVTLSRPIYIGAATLDESKRIYYNFYYNFILPTWRSPKTLAVDTDSWMGVVECDDAYLDMKMNEKAWFDMNAYNLEHPTWSKFHSSLNKKELGFMKDESANKPISEFVYLRPKMYSYIHFDDDKEYREVMKAKGISRVSLNQYAKFDLYKECLIENIQPMTIQHRIGSKNQVLYTMKQEKLGLSALDTKRYLNDDRITTLPFGHVSLKRKHSDDDDESDSKRQCH